MSGGTIARTICLALALVNQLLVVSGHSIIPVADDQIELLISTLTTIITAVIAWWENNSFTKEAIKADEYLEELKKNNEL